MYKILWDFEIQTDHLFPTGRLNLELNNKEKKDLPSRGFCHSSEPQMENKRKQSINKYLDLAKELKKRVTWK